MCVKRVKTCVFLCSPQAQMSTGLPYASFLNTSGDRYPGVPANPEVKHTHTQLTDTLKAADYISVLLGSACIERKIVICKTKPIHPHRDPKDRFEGYEGQLIVKLLLREKPHAPPLIDRNVHTRFR